MKSNIKYTVGYGMIFLSLGAVLGCTSDENGKSPVTRSHTHLGKDIPIQTDCEAGIFSVQNPNPVNLVI